MIKRIVFPLVFVLFLVLSAVALASCDTGEPAVYDVVFLMPNGDEVERVVVPTKEGEIPVPPAGYETDLSNVDKVGTFVRWDKELIAPTKKTVSDGETMTYTPVYEYATRYYTVTFVVQGTEYPVRTAGNQTPVCPVTPPAKATDPNGINLDYLGWDKEVAAVTEDTVYTARYGSTATVLAAKDGAKAVLTISYDDGNYDSAVWVNQMNKTYGLKGSCMIIAGRDSFTGKVSQWKTLLADGTLDIQSHGWYHDRDHTDYGSHADHVKDVVTSKEALQRYFPNNDVLVYATPYTTITDYSYKVSGDENSQIIQDGGTRALIHEHYYANRNGPSGLQSLDPKMGDDKGAWYNLYVQWLKTESSQTNKIRTGWIDNAVKQGGWLIILAHSVVDNPDSEWNISKTNAETFYKHAQTYVKTGELWSATFGEAVKYIRERQNTTVTERYENGAVFVDMKINRTTADGLTLTQKVFNYPLTVEVRVPSGWKLAQSTDENGETMTSAVYTRNGVSYTRVNMVPGADGAIVTTQITPLSVN